LASEIKKALLEALAERELRGKLGEAVKYEALLSIFNILGNILIMKAVMQRNNARSKGEAHDEA